MRLQLSFHTRTGAPAFLLPLRRHNVLVRVQHHPVEGDQLVASRRQLAMPQFVHLGEWHRAAQLRRQAGRIDLSVQLLQGAVRLEAIAHLGAELGTRKVHHELDRRRHVDAVHALVSGRPRRFAPAQRPREVPRVPVGHVGGRDAAHVQHVREAEHLVVHVGQQRFQRDEVRLGLGGTVERVRIEVACVRVWERSERID